MPVQKGVAVSELFHFEEGRKVPGPDPQRSGYNTFCTFSDPDGNRLDTGLSALYATGHDQLGRGHLMVCRSIPPLERSQISDFFRQQILLLQPK